MTTNIGILRRAASIGIIRRVASTEIAQRVLAGSAVYYAGKLASKGIKAPFSLDREFIAKTYISGDGLEIGGLHNPLRVPKRARVKYVDRMPVAKLRKQYPELRAHKLVHVD